MRLGLQLLNTDATVNNFKPLQYVQITKGETLNLVFQLMDTEKALRYMPAAGATVYVEISRFPEYFGTVTNVRSTVDYSVRAYAAQLSPLDASIWYIPLTSDQTANMTSTSIRVTVTEAPSLKIAILAYAIKAVNIEET